MRFREISVQELSLNPMTMIAKEWMLITAGNEARGYNTMTASWGHLGSIWGHGGGLPTAAVYIRPQRYTKEFMDREELYTLTVFPQEYKKQLGYLGSHSGRDEDKVANSGLTPVFGEDYTYFAEAKLVLVCRKLYRAPLVEEGFLDKSIVEDCYSQRDFHDLYIGEIIKVLVPEE
ncbi:MAG: flavin reductase [Oscillospiraceae bacterium]|nr:flavin reductase [Oscillospiraceae bacterium]